MKTLLLTATALVGLAAGAAQANPVYTFTFGATPFLLTGTATAEGGQLNAGSFSIDAGAPSGSPVGAGFTVSTTTGTSGIPGVTFTYGFGGQIISTLFVATLATFDLGIPPIPAGSHILSLGMSITSSSTFQFIFGDENYCMPTATNCIASGYNLYRDIEGTGTYTVADVPEPASMALLGAGLLGLGFARRRAR